jgi:hypothetical protein
LDNATAQRHDAGQRAGLYWKGCASPAWGSQPDTSSLKPHASIMAINGRIKLHITGHMDLAFRRLMHGPAVSRDRR